MGGGRKCAANVVRSAGVGQKKGSSSFLRATWTFDTQPRSEYMATLMMKSTCSAKHLESPTSQKTVSLKTGMNNMLLLLVP
uniref:Uncharacterized protein n=1 Tax=Hyaloperonospora arabidopsidis (strain Emoy2) TaxID=559515 RepID=M4BYT5_HYAAE